MNELTIVGNLTADPVLRMSANGRGVVRFDVAINRRRFNRETNQYDDLPPVFHRVVAFGPVAEDAAETLRKGLEVVAVGQMADDSYETETGENQLLDRPPQPRDDPAVFAGERTDVIVKRFLKFVDHAPSVAR